MQFADRLSLCWRVLTAKPGNLLAHAERELPRDGSEMQALMNRGLREMVLVFSSQGHSGMSAAYARHALDRLLAFEPIGPLTGEESEWVEVGEGVHQNRRCSRVFKRADRFDGRAYDIEGIVFREPSGACFTNADSCVPVVFPYTPSTTYVDRPEAA